MKLELKEFKPPYFIHSDILNAHSILLSQGKFDKKINICENHFNFLKNTLGEKNLIFPSFNYTFGSKLEFDLSKDESEVGSLTEWIRKNSRFYRSLNPFFSILTKDKFINFRKYQNPFDKNSFFDKIFNIEGTFLFYGVNFSIFTAIHYLETMLGPVPYRYEKVFKGKIIDKEKYINCEVVMHVRPRNSGLDYAWSKMQNDLIEENILKISKNFQNLYFCRSGDIFKFFKKKLSEDIFYMLNKESKEKFFNLTNGGKKKVLINDFE
jgi:aminoglycoside 3-N-acetyltransferase